MTAPLDDDACPRASRLSHRLLWEDKSLCDEVEHDSSLFLELGALLWAGVLEFFIVSDFVPGDEDDMFNE